MPDTDVGLIQMADGVHHIHSKNLVHRDIKPSNILISLCSPSGQVCLKISDFGLSKPTSVSGNFSLSGVKGTSCYMAPELLGLTENEETLNKVRGNIASDVFGLGCVFFYYLTKGTHPFGDAPSCPINIIKGRFDLNGKGQVWRLECRRLKLTTVLIDSCENNWINYFIWMKHWRITKQ